MFPYSGADLRPKNDAVFRFSQDHTLYPPLYVKTKKNASFCCITFYYADQQKHFFFKHFEISK